MIFAALRGLPAGSDEQHAWVPGAAATLCGIEVPDSPPQLRVFPPATGRSCLYCLKLAWQQSHRP
jgi:hypothetical protein